MLGNSRYLGGDSVTWQRGSLSYDNFQNCAGMNLLFG